MLYFYATVPVLIGVIYYTLPIGKAGKAVAVVAQAALTCYSFHLFFLCKQGEIVSTVGNYSGVMGITLKADTLSSVFVALVSFLFLMAALYSLHENYSKRYWLFLFIWQGLLNGIFLTCDLFSVFVFIEAVTVVVSVMVMYNRDGRSMYDGILYLMVNTVAMQFYLFGIGYLYKLTGALDMDAVAASVRSLEKTSLVLPFALIMTSICLKCAMMPLYSWLPHAHGTPSAPSAVSALLSGLHIKSGIYLFIRFLFIFDGMIAPEFFIGLGIVTGAAGFIFALSESDVKRILAYSTVSQVGMIMAGLNLPNSYANIGGIYHMVNHALFKTVLFLSAGVITQAYGTRDVNGIRGVMRRIPSAGAATAMAVLGITGTPFFNGSISKYFIMAGAGRALSAALMFLNLGTIIVFIKYSTMLFGQPLPGASTEEDLFIRKYEVGIGKKTAILIPGALCFAGGVFGEQIIHFLFNVRVTVDAGGYGEKALIFGLSAAAGFLIFSYLGKCGKALMLIKRIDPGFREICVLLGLFFAVVLIVSRISVL